MGCRLAENAPLKLLRNELGLAPQCHSLRPDCLHKLARPRPGAALGAAGAVIGYCQALFHRHGSPSDHTRLVAARLEEIGAPWALSHELFWGQRWPEEGAAEFIDQAVAPLAGAGRIPILITPLRPAADAEVISTIVAVSPASLDEMEPILLRLVLADRADVDAIAAHLLRELEAAAAAGRMPRWWPLVQSNMDGEMWLHLRQLLGSAWQFLNVAVNPFTPARLIETLGSQITVAQFPIGLGEDMAGRWIGIPKGMPISGKGDATGYDFEAYVQILEGLSASPTAIVLGPSDPAWSTDVNQQRIESFIPYLHIISSRLWGGISRETREMVWALAA